MTAEEFLNLMGKLSFQADCEGCPLYKTKRSICRWGLENNELALCSVVTEAARGCEVKE